MLYEFSSNKIIEIYENVKLSMIEKSNEYKYEEIMKYDAEAKEQKKEKAKENETEENFEEEIWQVEIPKINLIAPIAEGTSQEVMLEYVGHFENTSSWKGNVGLAAHNRGYPINYFARLKELKKGDKVTYKTKYGTNTYEIKTIAIIEDTDWSYLQKTKEDTITLITCVENKPSQRLCLQGIKIKEE